VSPRAAGAKDDDVDDHPPRFPNARLDDALTERLAAVVAGAEPTAAELRRVELLRVELDDLRADLAVLDRRARALRGKWLGRDAPAATSRRSS
jgi:hypothetical protein